MPYIKIAQRHDLNDPIESLLDMLSIGGLQVGQLNFVLTRLVNGFVVRSGGNYAAHSAAHGVLSDVLMEHYRRRTAPYEDTKIIENGDVI